MKALAIAAIVILSAPAWGASYPLACRGGDETSIHWMKGNFPQPDWAYFTFKKTAQGHNARPVEESECAWLDRGVRWNEPYRVCISGVSVNSFVTEVSGEHLATSWNASPDKRSLLSGKLYGRNVFKILVENDGRGCLQYRGPL